MSSQKLIKYFLGLVVIVGLILLAFSYLGTTPPAPIPLPNPNGYDDFVKAGEMVKGSLAEIQKLSAAELSNLVTTNIEALNVLRIGLGRECRVTNNYTNGYTMTQATAKLHSLAALKQIALLLNAEGRLAEKTGQTNEAAKSYLDGINFGVKCGQGGILSDEVIAIALENIALQSLKGLAPYGNIDTHQIAELARQLEAIDTKEEPITNVFKQEKIFADAVFGMRGKISQLLNRKELEAGYQKSLQKIQSTQLRRRQLMLELAARAYQLEKGHPHNNAIDLVPTYLKSVPQDPATGTNLVLSP